MRSLILKEMRFPFTFLLVGLMFMSIACSSAVPQVSVLGLSEGNQRRVASQAQSVRLFLEVANPSDSPLRLSRLRYQLRANEWIETADEIALDRTVRAHGVVVVEVPVMLEPTENVAPLLVTDDSQAFRFSLDGRLFAVSNRMERSFRVRVDGHLGPDKVVGVSLQPRVHIRIADSE